MHIINLSSLAEKMKNLESKNELNEHRWLGYAACNFEMLECQTCKLIVKRKDALNGLYPVCLKPHPKGGNLYKFTDEVVYGKGRDTKCKYCK